MNPATLLSSPPSSSQNSLLLLSPPFRFHPPSLSRRRRSSKLFLPRNSSTTATTEDIFGGKKDLTGIQPVVEKLSSPPIRFATSALVLAGAIAAGYSLGLRFGGTRNAALTGGALVGAAAGGAAVYAVNAAVPEVAAVDLHNYVAGFDDPVALNKEHIENIAKKYGVSKQDASFNLELCDLYCCFVSYVLPLASDDLRGDEADKIIAFKNALGIDDFDAAAQHMEIGRRIFRQRLETGDRDGNIEQRRAFQKLIYVSTLVFGDASAFLLPWKRVFKMTDAQVEIAIRENSKWLYANMLSLIGRGVDPNQLIALREAQLKYRLPDEIAEDMFREHTRKLVEENISVALSILKSRTRPVGGFKQAIGEVDRILAFNTLLISLKDDSDADRFARGVAPISLVGGEYEKKTDDLKLLYRAYVSDSLAAGPLEDNKLAALSQLRNVFGLGIQEAEAIKQDVILKLYQKRLSEAVQDGRLEMATSKAAFLQNLCDELRFDTAKASKIHEDIYRKKLLQCVADGELDDEDVSALLKLRVMLCIPQQTVDAAHMEICGGLFEKAVKDAIGTGDKSYYEESRIKMIKSAHGLRLSREAAMSIASKIVRKVFLVYIKRACAGTRSESVEELTKMLVFDSSVATKLVKDIKGEAGESPRDAIVEKEWPTDDEDEEVSGESNQPGKAEIISLREDISQKIRIDLYKSYLVYCLTGQGKDTYISMDGLTPTTRRTLKQLGGILGITKKEIVYVRRIVAELAFRQKAETLLGGDDQVTMERIEQLNEYQKKVRVAPEYAEKVIKSITTNKMSEAIENAAGKGKLDIQQIRKLKESGIDLDKKIPVKVRERLFKKTINEMLSSGTGEFDEEEVFEKLPSVLSIDSEKAKGVVRDLAQSRLRNSLIQAVSLLRQRNRQGVVSSLNDLLVCANVVGSEGVSWDVAGELADMYRIYATTSNPDPQMVSRLQSLLGISDSAAAALRENVMPHILEEEENFVF